MAALTRSLTTARRRPGALALATAWCIILAAAAVLAAGCSCARPAGEGLEKIDWRLAGSSASAVNFGDFDVTARFEDGALSGSSGVNTYSAKYAIRADGSLTVSALQVTAKAGGPDAMRAEEVYLALLRAVRAFKLAEGTLELRDADGNALLVFRRRAASIEKSATPGEAPAEGPASSEATAAVDVPGLSDTSVAYARSIGGTSHRGELLYFVVGTVHPTEAAASAALNSALPSFGDMQSYFIVQRSDNLAGLTRGQWVIVEAYRNFPDEANLQFARRAFPDASVKRATVVSDDPIPVYEDLVR